MSTNYNELNKAELINIINELQNKLNSPKSNRKLEVLSILKSNPSISIQQIADQLNTSKHNISSLLTYLKADGYIIYTDHNKNKLLQNPDHIPS